MCGYLDDVTHDSYKCCIYFKSRCSRILEGKTKKNISNKNTVELQWLSL